MYCLWVYCSGVWSRGYIVQDFLYIVQGFMVQDILLRVHHILSGGIWFRGVHCSGRILLRGCIQGRISQRQPQQMPWLLPSLPWCPLNLASTGGIIMPNEILVKEKSCQWFWPAPFYSFSSKTRNSRENSSLQLPKERAHQTCTFSLIPKFTQGCNLSNSVPWCHEPKIHTRHWI